MIARGQTPLRDFRRGQRQGIEISRGEGVCWRSGEGPLQALWNAESRSLSYQAGNTQGFRYSAGTKTLEIS